MPPTMGAFFIEVFSTDLNKLESPLNYIVQKLAF